MIDWCLVLREQFFSSIRILEKILILSDIRTDKRASFVSPNNFCYFATFSCFRFTPGLAFGEKDIGHPAITEYLPLTGKGKLRNRKIISERKQTFYGNSLSVRRTDKESIFVRLNIFLSANPTKPTLFRYSAISWWEQVT